MAADRATAQGINLTGADLPGWQQSPNQTSAAEQAMSARMAQCAGAPNPASVDVVDVNSPDFDQGQTEVSSDVTMVRTPRDGTADLEAIRSSKLGSCVQQIALPFVKTQLPAGAKLSNLVLTRFSPSGLPAASFAYRLTTTVTVPGQGAAAINSDTIGFQAGRAEVELDVTQTGGPPDPSLEQRLLSTLVGRAKP